MLGIRLTGRHSDMYGGNVVHMNVTDTKLNRLTDTLTDTDEIRQMDS